MKSNIVIKPVITEKSFALATSQNKYTFVVGKDSGKLEIKDTVEKLYGVKVLSVRCITKPGNVFMNWSTRTRFRKPDVKKAVVQLKEGDKIDEFLNI